MKKLLVALFLVCFAHIGIAQTISSQFLREFRVEIIGNHVNAQWRTGIDFTCNDVDLYFGKDSNSMSLIYSYPGTCGSNTEEKDYSFIHNNPEYGFLYYQLRLGSFGDSKIHVLNHKKVSEYLTYPNPAVDHCYIEFSEVKSGKVELTFFTANGLQIGKQESLVKNLMVPTSSFPTGLIYFKAKFSENGIPVNGKFLNF